MFNSFSWRHAGAYIAMVAASYAHAEHIIGGEIYYDYLGNDRYRVTLTLYRDCYGPGAQFDDLGYLTVYRGNGVLDNVYWVAYPGSTFVPVVLDNPCLVFPPNLCVETTSYAATLLLPADPRGYTISYQRCCRQPNVLNVVNPALAGLTCTTRIPPPPLHANSSPRFNMLPPIALCQNEPLVFDHSATDPDGDFLEYSFITPYTGGTPDIPYPFQATSPPYTPLIWASGYGPGRQMDSQPAMAIDPVTGMLTVRPTLRGNFVIAVSVKEYRDGVLLSESIRDFLFSVVGCNTAVAAIAPQTVFCPDDLSLTFGNNSTGARSWRWDFGDPGTTADVSDLRTPSWTYPAHGTYTVTLIANPGLFCADTTQMDIHLYRAPEPSFADPGPGCGSMDTVLTVSDNHGPMATFAWAMSGGAIPSQASGPQADVAFPSAGAYPVTLTVQENGCTGSFTRTVLISPFPEAFFSSDPASPQPDLSDVLFTDLSSGNGVEIVSSRWLLDGQVVQNGGGTWAWNDARPRSHVITLEVTTADGCTARHSMNYTIIPEDIHIPNVFSPNEDGQNDAFVIENVQYYGNALTIYNRWGQAIYEATNYANQWRASGIPEGTYYYVLRLEDGREFAGHLTLLR